MPPRGLSSLNLVHSPFQLPTTTTNKQFSLLTKQKCSQAPPDRSVRPGLWNEENERLKRLLVEVQETREVLLIEVDTSLG